jgi:hypothetical protein
MNDELLDERDNTYNYDEYEDDYSVIWPEADDDEYDDEDPCDGVWGFKE